MLIFLFISAIFYTGDLYAQCTWTWYLDADHDGFGSPHAFISTACGASAPEGYVANRLDCNDAAPGEAIWGELGRQIGTFTAFSPEIDVSADSIPFVLFVSDDRISVSSYTKRDERWRELGAHGFSAVIQQSQSVSMALAGNTPYVSYSTQAGPGQLSVMHYTGSGWQHTGALPVVASVSQTNIATYRGEPYVVYNTTGNDLYVLRYTAGTWQVVGGAPMGVGSFPKIAIDKNTGAVYVAYSDESDGSGRMTVRMYSGTWTTVGQAGVSVDFIEYAQLALDDSGRVYIAYFDYGLNTIVVKYFDAGGWRTTGANDVYTDFPSTLSLAIDAAGIPYVAYSYFDYGVNVNSYAVKKLVDNRWEDAASNPLERGEGGAIAMGDQLSIALAPDRIPYVALRDINNSDYISVMHLTAPSCPLPVTLLYFRTGVTASRQVLLQWATVSAVNLSHFAVERTLDGDNFSTLRNVALHGNGKERQLYSFTDSQPAPGKNYYRLKIADQDGSYKYSALVVADLTDTETPRLVVYPNPTTGRRIGYHITIDPQPEDLLQIINSLGQEVYRSSIDLFRNELDLENVLTSGSYILKYISAGRHLAARFVVR